MQNVLIATFGSLGDILPFVGVGGELRRRGHDVTFISNPYFEPHAVNAGLSFSPVGTLEQFHKVATNSGVFHWKTALERALPSYVHMVEGTYDATMRLYRPGQTVLFGGPGSLGALIAHEQNRIPMAWGLVSPSRLPSRYDPPHPARPLPAWARPLAQSRRGLGLLYLLMEVKRRFSRRWSAPQPLPSPNPVLDEVNRIRARLQLPAMAGLNDWRLPFQRILCMWPDWFGKRQKDWPPETVITGFPYYPPSGDEPEHGSGRPTMAPCSESLVFTTGSVASHQQAFFAAAVEPAGS